jgi:hypothetical protein
LRVPAVSSLVFCDIYSAITHQSNSLGIYF